jgi:hypothetical protein
MNTETQIQKLKDRIDSLELFVEEALNFILDDGEADEAYDIKAKKDIWAAWKQHVDEFSSEKLWPSK